MTKKALVTGASGGIGLEFAKRLASVGYEVTLVARNRAKLEALVAEMGPGHRAFAADLSNAADTQRVCDELRATRYDLLINNAGVGVYGYFTETPLEKTQAMMRLNIDSLVALSHAYLSGAKEGDALVNVASTLARLGLPGATTYSATKAFVTAFSEGLWWEHRSRGVYVTALLPGVTKTNFHEAAGGASDERPPEAISQTSAQVVDEAMHALETRSAPSFVTGLVNKAMIFFTSRFASRAFTLNLMGGNAPVKPKSADA